MRKTAGRACLLWAAGLLSVPAQAVEVVVLKSVETAAWRPILDALARQAGHTFSEHDLKNDRVEALRILGEQKGKAVVLLALGPLAAEAARAAAPELPLVFAMVPEPATLGLLGIANVSGVAAALPVRNQLAAFRSVNPRAVRIGALYSADSVAKLVNEAVQSAGVVRLVVVPRRVATLREVPEALKALFKGPEAVDAVWLPDDPLLGGEEARRVVFDEALKGRRPVYASSTQAVEQGALVSNAPDPLSIAEQIAELLVRQPGSGRADLLVPRGELAINKKIADQLKLEIPASALAAAARIH